MKPLMHHGTRLRSAGLPLIGYGIIFNLGFAALGGFVLFLGIYGLGLEPSTDPDAAHGPDDHGDGGHGDDSHDGGADDGGSDEAVHEPEEVTAGD